MPGRRAWCTRRIITWRRARRCGHGAMRSHRVFRWNRHSDMKTNWIKVAKIGTLPEGLPVSLTAADVQVDAYVQESVIRHLWAVKKSDTEIIVFSPICPHLGCYYNWNPASGRFECPCHGSVYGPDGTVLGGPAPAVSTHCRQRLKTASFTWSGSSSRAALRKRFPYSERDNACEGARARLHRRFQEDELLYALGHDVHVS